MMYSSIGLSFRETVPLILQGAVTFTPLVPTRPPYWLLLKSRHSPLLSGFTPGACTAPSCLATPLVPTRPPFWLLP